MNSETKVSQLGQNIAQGLDEALENLCGERMGFVLMVFPLNRGRLCRDEERALVTENYLTLLTPLTTVHKYGKKIRRI